MTSTDRPYTDTDTDLRAEAARQHATLAEDPDFMGVGEMMDGRHVHYEADEAAGCLMPPPGTPRWDELDEDTFEAAQRSIHDLINGAADVSEWAVELGADGLEPSEQQLTLGRGEPRVRIHFAFAPDMSETDRRDFVAEIAAATVTAS